MPEVSELDKLHLKLLRENIRNFLEGSAKIFDNEKNIILDVAPQDHNGAKEFFLKSKIETLDIDPKSTTTYIADICNNNSQIIKNEKFDLIVCTEVLEHTFQPFDAVKELFRMVKKGGYVLITVPFNFRIHGPLPDCWRFTEHGLRALLKDFSEVEIIPLEDENRFLMPIQYCVKAKK